MVRILQIERFDKRRKVVGEGVVVVSVPRLTCAAMNAAAAGNSTISVGSQKVHLIFKGVRGEQPTLSAIRIFLLTSADRPGDPARSRELRNQRRRCLVGSTRLRFHFGHPTHQVDVTEERNACVHLANILRASLGAASLGLGVMQWPPRARLQNVSPHAAWSINPARHAVHKADTDQDRSLPPRRTRVRRVGFVTTSLSKSTDPGEPSFFAPVIRKRRLNFKTHARRS